MISNKYIFSMILFHRLVKSYKVKSNFTFNSKIHEIASISLTFRIVQIDNKIRYKNN